MPELPEVETTCRGIRPYLEGRVVADWILREGRLRWPVADELKTLVGQRVTSVSRRAKYILLKCDRGAVIVHLGMSGSLRICVPETEWRKHDHLALGISSELQMRYHDPRRFGCWLWVTGDPMLHPLLRNLGPEPLSEDFNADLLYQTTRKRRTAIKPFIMDAKQVVGVGNIYACEALFMAGIDPQRSAGSLSKARLELLVESIRKVLLRSIEQGGTTLRDFLNEDGKPGYFSQQLQVYDRAKEPCPACGSPVTRIVQGQRSTFYCRRCQR